MDVIQSVKCKTKKEHSVIFFNLISSRWTEFGGTTPAGEGAGETAWSTRVSRIFIFLSYFFVCANLFVWLFSFSLCLSLVPSLGYASYSLSLSLVYVYPFFILSSSPILSHSLLFRSFSLSRFSISCYCSYLYIGRIEKEARERLEKKQNSTWDSLFNRLNLVAQNAVIDEIVETKYSAKDDDDPEYRRLMDQYKANKVRKDREKQYKRRTFLLENILTITVFVICLQDLILQLNRNAPMHGEPIQVYWLMTCSSVVVGFFFFIVCLLCLFLFVFFCFVCVVCQSVFFCFLLFALLCLYGYSGISS